MAISKRVQTQLSCVIPGESQSRGGRHQHNSSSAPITSSASSLSEPSACQDTSLNPISSTGRAWTSAEHERFVQALQLFPSGPWKAIAAVVGTKTARQTMSHAQKCRQKQERWQRGLKIQSRKAVVGRSSVVPGPVASDNSSNRSDRPPVEKVRCNADAQTVDRLLINEDQFARSHVTPGNDGDVGRLTQFWGDAHGRAQDQHRHQHPSAAASHDAMGTAPVFAVFGAFEALDCIWAPTSSGGGVSSMGPLAPAPAGREGLLCLFQPNAN